MPNSGAPGVQRAGMGVLRQEQLFGQNEPPLRPREKENIWTFYLHGHLVAGESEANLRSAIVALAREKAVKSTGIAVRQAGRPVERSSVFFRTGEIARDTNLQGKFAYQGASGSNFDTAS